MNPSSRVSANIERTSMRMIEVKVPDYLAKLAAEVAGREKVSVDQNLALPGWPEPLMLNVSP